MLNLNLLFYKTYYDTIHKTSDEFLRNIKKNNSQICNAVFDHNRDYAKSPIATDTIVFKTAYPGLLIGTGISHGSGLCNDDINCGFYFDYVTGQPFIPASSVKGALRSCFRNTPDVIKELIDIDAEKIKDLERELFEGEDRFLDAVIFDGDKYGYIIGKESITPHGCVSKNPVPISLLKILPDVRLEFRFILKDGSITASQKKQFFAKLIELFGIGAKTNVGYGILHECDDNISPKEKQDEVQAKSVENGSKERVVCSRCGMSNYKYYPDGNLRRKCKQCNNFL